MIAASQMPPVNLLDPFMLEWVDRVGHKIRKDGRTFTLLPTHWPNGEEIEYIGVMADETEQTHPEAVAEINGTKFVSYERLLICQNPSA